MEMVKMSMVRGVKDVVEGNYCAGCGACVVQGGGTMSINRFGEFVPDIASGAVEDSIACPFLHPEQNENFLAKEFFPDPVDRTDELGYFEAIYAAHVVEGEFRAQGSSGGMGSWLGAELLKKGLIDGVIHVKPAIRNRPEDPFFRYGISKTVDELNAGAHSHYHVVEMSEVMQYVLNNSGRYLFVGVPCFAKAVRRLQLHNPVLRERIRFVVSLICGHLKSINWSLSLGWGAGVSPNEFKEIKFRMKGEGIPAKAYYFGVKSTRDDNAFQVLDSARVVGGKFNLGAMMLNACNFCDDVVGETADISIGDAWLPQYAFDWRGKNMLVIRNTELAELIREAAAEGRVSVDAMSAEDAAKAQSGGFRQRREGLAYRVEKKKRANEWAPVKREFSDIGAVKFHRKVIYDLREKCASESRLVFLAALHKKDFSIYERRMRRIFKLLRYAEIGFSLPLVLSRRMYHLISRFK